MGIFHTFIISSWFRLTFPQEPLAAHNFDPKQKYWFCTERSGQIAIHKISQTWNKQWDDSSYPTCTTTYLPNQAALAHLHEWFAWQPHSLERTSLPDSPAGAAFRNRFIGGTDSIYKAYVKAKFQETSLTSPQNMAPNIMVLYLHSRVLKFPLIYLWVI